MTGISSIDSLMPIWLWYLLSFITLLIYFIIQKTKRKHDQPVEGKEIGPTPKKTPQTPIIINHRGIAWKRISSYVSFSLPICFIAVFYNTMHLDLLTCFSAILSAAKCYILVIGLNVAIVLSNISYKKRKIYLEITHVLAVLWIFYASWKNIYI